MELKRPLRLVYVEWEDASTRCPWMELEEIDAYRQGQFLVRQCGFLLEDTGRYLLLADTWTPGDDWHTEKFGNVTRIPKPWIHKHHLLQTITDDGQIRRRTR